MSKKIKKEPPIKIEHKTTHVSRVCADIDLYVYTICRALWEKDIVTFHSCQGGPGYAWPNGDVAIFRAYVTVRVTDIKRAVRVLKRLDLNPKVDKKLEGKRQVAIRFDPSLNAMDNVPPGYFRNLKDPLKVKAHNLLLKT